MLKMYSLFVKQENCAAHRKSCYPQVSQLFLSNVKCSAVSNQYQARTPSSKMVILRRSDWLEYEHR